MNAVEALLRKASKKPRGKMQIKRRHVDKLLSSNSSVSRDRQTEGRHHLGMRSGAHLEPSAHKRGHDSDDEPLGALRARGIAALQDGAKGKSHRVELRGSITVWLEENEERVEGQPFLLRPGKLNQLKASRQQTLTLLRRRLDLRI